MSAGVSRIEAAEEVIARRKGRTTMLGFLQYVWWMPGPLIIGRHTIAICEAIDQAITAFLAGESSFLDIAVPFRHGKSDIVSRALPAYFLARCAEQQPDIIMSGYGAELVEGFSLDAKRIINSDAYKRLFPALRLARGANNIASWSMDGSAGKVTVAGLGGSYMGKGGSLIIIDDYCKGIVEARSENFRDKSWASFTSIMTRRAPVSIVLIVATPWHVDDMQSRVRKEALKNPDFPKFKRLKFPARNPDGSFLFEERFPASWYREQYATQKRIAAGILDCEPTLEGGNRFATEIGKNIKVHTSLDDFPKTRYIRAWDLASSTKERDKDDPDWTVGIKGTVTHENKVPHLWLLDCVAIQAEAPRRDALIQSTARADGPGCPQYVEAFGGYKDAYTTLKAILAGISVVRSSHLPGDKAAKLSPLEPMFDAGNVHLLRAPWNDPLIRQFTEFPDGAHDDYCDPPAIIVGELNKCGGSGLL